MKQQILKLASGNYVDDEWILALDSDVILTREVQEEDLFVNGRAIAHLEQQGIHWGWWKASMELLGAQGIVDQEDAVLGVTPEFLHGPTLRNLTQQLTLAAGIDNWQTYLMKNRPDWADNSWTEYSLYWCYVLKAGLRERLYSNAKSVLYARRESI